MSGYTKLFSSIIASTIWREPDHVRVVWITMLAMATKDGVVEASIPGLADMARVSLPQCEQALTALRAPDPYSRTKDHDGRRIQDVDGGFLLLNHAKYRDKLSAEDRRDYQRQYRANYRADGRDKSRSTLVNTGQHLSTGSIHTEAEAEAAPAPSQDVGAIGRVEPTQPSLIPTPKAAAAAPTSQDDAAWLQGLKADPAYEGIDVGREHAKMLQWCIVSRKQATRRRFVNWLNRCDRTLATTTTTKPAPNSTF